MSILICLLSCDGHMVHLGSVCITPFIFTAAQWDIAAISERTEALNALPKAREENLWVEQEIEVVPISAFARPWAGAGSVPAAVQLLLPSQVIFSFQKTPFKVVWLLWPPADKCYVQGQCLPLQTNNLQCTAHQRLFVEYLEELKIPLKEKIFFTWLCYRQPFSERRIPHYHNYSQNCKVLVFWVFFFVFFFLCTHSLSLSSDF